MRIFKLIELERKLPWDRSLVLDAWQDKVLQARVLQLRAMLEKLKSPASEA